MKPYPYSADMPRALSDFQVVWPDYVREVTPIATADHAYLASIRRYTNHSEEHHGVTALRLELAQDAEAERLLDGIHQLPATHAAFAAQLLASPRAHALLGAFDADADSLRARVEAARFQYLSPFLLAGTMAEELYRYGMYRHFYDDHSANEARDQVLAFLRNTVGDDLSRVVPFTTRGVWGDWFDPHSCTDRSWLLVGRGVAQAWLLVFSHSD
jgi:hypothetical protein